MDRFAFTGEELCRDKDGDWVWFDDVESLTEENKRLRDALEKYGQHDFYTYENGEVYPCPFTRVGGPCKCGFAEALKEKS